MGTRKDRNGKDITEEEEIKKSWQEYTEELYKEGHNDLNITMLVWSLTQSQRDILECEVKWALGSITTNKASVGDEILAEPFKSPKDDAVKVLHSIHQQIWKSQQVVT